MNYRSCLVIVFLLLTFSSSRAQKIAGTWEGDMGGTEFLQINIVQVGDKVCGYTWDRMWRNENDYCKAYFSGSYDRANKTWYLDGYSFMENSGSHVLMQLKCYMEKDENGKTVLKGYSVIKSMMSTLFGGGSPNEILLQKVSDKPSQMTQTMIDCVTEMKAANEKVIAKSPVLKKPVVKPVVTKPVVKPPVIVTKKDTVIKKPVVVKKPVVIPPVVKKLPVTKPIIKKDTVRTMPIVKKKPDSVTKVSTPVVKKAPQNIPVPEQLSSRKNKEMSRIVVNDRDITLNVYDNATVDGDSVSIFYNGRLILNHQRLSDKPITIDLKLDENTDIHKITLFAENLGAIPPNTALIVVTTASGKRFELFSSATLEQNAVLVFEYKSP